MLPPTAYGDSRLSLWLRIRTYAVPPSMIELATGRRTAGDWAGACAAARIDVDPDLRSVARAHGRELAARLRADLRHLAPDLLRWHMPRIAPDGLLRPGLTLTLARYERPGRAGPLHLVARTPPAWADAGQRIGLALWDPADPPTGRHPHPRPNRRYRLDLHRHLWDARRSGELRDRSGADGPAPPDSDPLGLAPPGIGCAVGRWAAEARILLRAEERYDGAFAVRLGSRRQLVLAVAADGTDAPKPTGNRRGPDPTDGLSGPAGPRRHGQPHDSTHEGHALDPAENRRGAGAADGLSGPAGPRHHGQPHHATDEHHALDPAENRRGAGAADGLSGPAGPRHHGQRHDATDEGHALEPAENRRGAGAADGLSGPAGPRHHGQPHHATDEHHALEPAENRRGASAADRLSGPAGPRRHGQPHHATDEGHALDPAENRRGPDPADELPGPVGFPHHVASRDGAPRLRIVGELPPGGLSAVPVLPDAATWVVPDLELLRAGLLGPDRLHPLVAAALVPGHVASGAGRDPDPVARARQVECRGATHRIDLVDGVLVPLDHGPDEIRHEELLAALGGPPLPCLRVIDEAHRRPDCLTGVQERLDHGDTAGALAVVEGLLGPGAVLREGPLRDELAAAAERRIAYGLYRAGLAEPGGTSGTHSRRTGRSRRLTQRQARTVTYF